MMESTFKVLHKHTNRSIVWRLVILFAMFSHPNIGVGDRLFGTYDKALKREQIIRWIHHSVGAPKVSSFYHLKHKLPSLIWKIEDWKKKGLG